MTKSIKYWTVPRAKATGVNNVVEAPILGKYHPKANEVVALKEIMSGGAGTGKMRLTPKTWRSAEGAAMIRRLRFDIVKPNRNSSVHTLWANGSIGHKDHILSGYQLIAAEISVLKEKVGVPVEFIDRLYWRKQKGGKVVRTDWRWDP